MDRISLSAEFLALLAPLGLKNKIVEQLLADLDLNKFKEFLGMLKKLVSETEEELQKKNLSQVEVESMVEGLIKEMVNGPSIDIKCIVHNFVKTGAKKDPLFQKKTATSFKQAFEKAVDKLRDSVITKKLAVYDDPLPYIEPLRAMVWIHELIELYRGSITPELLKKSFEVVSSLVSGFAAYIDKHQFVTMKQSDLFTETLRVGQHLLDKDFRPIIVADPASLQTAHEMMANLQSLYKYADKMSRDLLFHFSFLLYTFSSETEGEGYKKKYFNMDTGVADEPARIALVAKIGAFVHYGKGIDLKEKIVAFQGKNYTLLEVLRENCCTNQLNLKTSAFRILKDAFDKIGKIEGLLAQFNSDKAGAEAIFEIVMQNWEFPIKGFANAMEDVFANYLSLFPGEEERLTLMKSILIKYPGTTRRKYASLRLLMKGVDIDKYLLCAPGIMREILTFEGISMAPFVVQLFKELLNQAYVKYSKIHKDAKDKDRLVEDWTNFWIKDYIDIVSDASYEHVADINEHINPQIFTICEKSLPIVITKLFGVTCKSTATFQSVKTSLLRYARSRDIFVCENNEFKLIGFEKQAPVDWKQFISEVICHNNRHISLDALRVILEPKKDSLNPQPIEYELLERAIIFDTKNSYPDYRNDMSVTIKKFLHRLRNNFNPLFKKVTDQKSYDELATSDKEFKLFTAFLGKLKTILVRENYPDAPYESVYPLLEAAKVVYESFNDQSFYFRKKTRFEGTNILQFAGYYDKFMFEMYLGGFKCQWDTIRKISFDTLRLFPKNLPYLTEDFKRERIMRPAKTVLLASPVIRDIEAATYSLSFLFERCETSDAKLTFVEELVNDLSQKQKIMKEFFFEGKKEFTDNLFHGLLPTLSIVLGEWPNFSTLALGDRKRAQMLYTRIMIEIKETINFAKGVIAKNHVTFILDNKDTEEAVRKKKEKYQKLMDKLDSANTLLDAFDDDEDIAAIQSDNMTVVAFYLISKESGNLFAKLLEVIVQSEMHTDTKDFFNPSEVIDLVRTFTDALLSIKHLGAIDKISQGLGFFCKKFYEMSNINYAGLAKELMTGIMASLNHGDCQTIFRRSAGLPNAVSSLLKAEPVGMKTETFPLVLKQLMDLAVKDVPGRFEVRIHGINILRVVFQDSELKQDMEHYIGQGLALAIRGFSDNDWSVRNSSLMLYSAIMKRLFPNVSNEAQANYRSGLNVIQFFVLRAPSLLKFFFDEILEFSKKSGEHNMYPTIYPISLLLSKLLPYDMKAHDEGAKEETIEDAGKNTPSTVATNSEDKTHQYKLNEIDDGSKSRFVTATEINQFRGLLLACSGSKNFLGRVLVARAIVPFIAFNDVSVYLDSILPKSLADIKKDHNSAHGRLLIAKFVVNNFKNVCLSSSFTFENGKSSDEVYKDIIKIFSQRQEEYLQIKCPPVLLTFLEIVTSLCQKKVTSEDFDHHVQGQFKASIEHSVAVVRGAIHVLPYRPTFDICLGELRKKMIEIVIRSHAKNQAFLNIYIGDILTLMIDHGEKMNTDDTDMLQYSLKYILEGLSPKTLRDMLSEGKTLLHLLRVLSDILLKNKKMVNLVKYLVEILGTGFDGKVITPGTEERLIFHKVIDTAFRENKENGEVLKELIMVGPYFCANEDTEEVAKLADMIKYYSEPDQKDDNRYNCVLALTLLKPRMKDLLAHDQKLYLSLKSSLIKLLIDELAAIRKKTCKIIYEPTQTLQNDNVALVEAFRQIFTDLSDYSKNLTDEKQKQDLAAQIQFFLMEVSCDPICEKYKYMAHYDSRIFNFDKPNKYKEEIKIIRAIISNLSLLPLRAEMGPEPNLAYRAEKHVKRAEALEKEAEMALEDPFKRSEFIFGQVMQGLFEKIVIGKGGESQIEQKFLHYL